VAIEVTLQIRMLIQGIRQRIFVLIGRLALVASVVLAAAGVQAGTLRIATGEWPPYATQERPDQGIALDIVRRAFAHEGVNVDYTFKPWTRSLEEARAGQWDATAYWGRNRERDVGFLISDNVLTEQWVLVYRQSAFTKAPFDWKTLADLKGLRVGIVRSYTYTPEFWKLQKSGVLNTVVMPDDLASLRLLLSGRLEVVPMERNVACYLLQKHLADTDVRDLRAHPKPFSPRFTTHVMFSEALPMSQENLRTFNRGLAALKRGPDYATLLEWPGCPLNAAPEPLSRASRR